MRRAIENPPRFVDGTQVAFCDFAAGGDQNVCALRRGNRVTVEAKWKETNTLQAVRRFIAIFERLCLKPYQVYCDGSGTGVTIYNNGGVTLSGNVSVNLTAPTSGNMVGMVYYQKPSDSQAFTVNGRAGTDNFAGGLYMPTADATLNGNLPSVTLLVAASITMNGGGMNASGPGLAVRHVVLGE